MLHNAWPEILPGLRKKAGLTQEDAAAAAGGVSTTTWYRWEKGDNVPHRSQFDCIARGLGMPPVELGLAYSQALRRHYVVTLHPQAFQGGQVEIVPQTAPKEPGPAVDAGSHDDPLGLVLKSVNATPAEELPGLRVVGEAMKRMQERESRIATKAMRLLVLVRRLTGIEIDGDLTSWISSK